VTPFPDSASLGIPSTIDGTPSAIDGSPDSPPAEPADMPAAQARAYLAGAHVLVVEDNAFNREIAQELLEQVGVATTLAEGGAAALECVGRRRFDCILMDMRMPEMNGLETTRRIRAGAGPTAGPIVAMTANASPEDRAACRSAGMNHFIAKPFTPERLYAVLACALAEGAATVAGAGVAGGKPAAPLLDYELLARTVRHDTAKVAKFAHSFVDNLRGGVVQAEAALANGDAAALRFLGHRLKSSALTVGALEVAELCEALEGARAEDDPACARTHVRRMHELIDEIAALVEKHEKMAAA
jgi:two-component system sensor histidine kinase/response regulator